MKNVLHALTIASVHDGTAFVSPSRDRMMMKVGDIWEVYATFEAPLSDKFELEREYILWMADRKLYTYYERPGWTSTLRTEELALEWRVKWM